ncbi:flagellin [Chthonobacter rhizosphaerae]|uniref:flagellin N-terminal helical domain-containing protein n=1 Tax=Chthonobacter rhizosphaerae TaxID=2735553 RepID=UPI0015EE5F9C|nr:flagellin [Chthonobacter rhizosphaerae]
MASLLTNASAQIALQNLQSINRTMDGVQNRIATGMRVSTAADNAAYWSIATTMRSDNMALDAVKDALGLGAATVDVQYTALNSTVDVMKEIKAKLVAALQPGVDRVKIQSDITQLQGQLKTIANSAVFNGQNWLDVNSAATGFSSTRKIVSAFTRDAEGKTSISTIDVDLSTIILNDAVTGATSKGILSVEHSISFSASASISGAQTVLGFTIKALTNSDADREALIKLTDMVDGQLGKITAAATDLGSAKKRVDLQKTFVKALTDAVERGIGQLVDADLDKDSSILKATQVQQQLGIQALQIANGNSQNILALFRN